MSWKNKSSIGIIVILLAALGLVLGSGSGLAKVASEKTPALISLDVRQMDLQDVLRLIAEKANVNIIAGKEVAGEVTLRLKNVDLWQALDAVLGAGGFTYREEEGIIRVVKAKALGEVETPMLETKIMFLKFAKAEDVKKAFQHLLSASGTMEADPTSNALIVTDIPKDIENIKKRVDELEEAAREKAEKEKIEQEKMEEVVESLQKRVDELEEAAREKAEKPPVVLEKKRFPLNYINVEEKKDTLNSVLDNIIGEEGECFLDFLTNSVSVEASSSCIKKIEEYLKGVDVPPERIMIKAEFVEVNLEALKELGIKWRWKGAYEEYPLGSTFRYDYYLRPEPGEEVPDPRAPLQTLASGMGIIFGSVEQEFRGIVDMLITKDKANLLSSPSIVTLEGQEARIHVGDNYPYKIKSWKEGELFETTEFMELGATLLVTPHIKKEKRIVLDIHPEVKQKTGEAPWEGGPPIVGTRDAKTQIEVEDGKSIVIGGLLKETETYHKGGVPLLSRLPILGSLFSYKKIEKKKTDLLIFITPHILPEKLEEENVVEKRKPLKVQMEELCQKGLDYKKRGEYEKAGESFEEVISKSRMYGFSDYLEYAEKELVELEKLEKKRLEEEKREKARLEKERLEEERLEKARLEEKEKEKARLEKARLEKQRQERKKLVKEIYHKGLDYRRAGEYEKARESFEEVISKSRMYGFSDYLRYGERELARVERLEKKRLEEEEKEKARLEKARLEKQRQERKKLVKEIYHKGLDYRRAGEYEKARESFEEVINKSRMYGFSDYLRYGEKQLVRLERLEKKRLEKK